MGGAESSELAKREYENARASFSPEEIKHFDEFFWKLAQTDEHSPSHSPTKIRHGKFGWDRFEKFTGENLSKNAKTKIYGEFCRITDSLTFKSDSKQVTYDAYYVGLSRLLKGSLDDNTHMVKLMCQENTFSEEIHLADVTQYLSNLASNFFKLEKESKNFISWRCQNSDVDVQQIVDFFISDWHKFLDSKDDRWLEKWLGSGPMVSTMMSTVFCAAFDLNFAKDRSDSFCTSSIPQCVVNDWRHFRGSFLNLPSLFLLNMHIPQTHRHKWRLLYSSAAHGESFSSLLKLIINEGPMLIIIKEKCGHIFGAFTSVGLDLNPNFVGDDRCFVFTLSPQMRIYQATGFNKNFCYLNMHQETMPNGLGFGGRLAMDDQPVHFFGLWLDSSYGKGKSQAGCSTYNNPQLSSAEHFEIFELEVWGVGDKPDNKKEKKITSILDIDPEVKAMLAMTGKGPVSEGLRETDETAGMVENISVHTS